MIIWTDRAVLHMEEFIKNAKADTENTARRYINGLIDYAEELDNMPKLGKIYNTLFSNYEIRQLIYKSHKVYYTIQKDDIVILAVLHSKMDIKNALKNILK